MASDAEVMKFDVLIVGAGPAGLSCACRLKQLNPKLEVCVIEKGSEVGAHIVSGAVIDPRSLNELFPKWKELGAPLKLKAKKDKIILLRDEKRSFNIPAIFTPHTMHNHGNYIVSLANFTRWLGEQAEELGVEIFPGFPAKEILYDGHRVKGIMTGDMGVKSDNTHKDSYTSGIALEADFTIFSEGSRGHLGKELIQKFDLKKNRDPQHYGLGIKELWDIDSTKHQPGLVIHGSGWPLDSKTGGGFFLYHCENNQVAVGLIVDLNYSNPWISPYDEFQRLKHHPELSQYLAGGKRISYGARSITKGGFNSLPKMDFPGGLLIGCDAGTLNFSRIKGTHTAMKSGIIAADSIFETIQRSDNGINIENYSKRFKESWLYDELFSSRNFGPALHKFGRWFGGAFNTVDQNLLKGKQPLTLHDRVEDHTELKKASDSIKISYPKPDGKISFDKLSSVYLSGTNHEEDQPCHLILKQEELFDEVNLPLYAEPAQRYCPAGVYELVSDESGTKLQINAQNCLHCKTCDIKDPRQNIQWVPPEGSGGPNYPNM